MAESRACPDCGARLYRVGQNLCCSRCLYGWLGWTPATGQAEDDALREAHMEDSPDDGA